VTVPAKTQKTEKINAALLRAIARGGVNSGAIDPREKTEAEVARYVFAHATSILDHLEDPNFALNVTLDHSDALLRGARAYTRRKKPELACLLYATWFEHWINHLMSVVVVRDRGFTKKMATQIIRDVSLKGKRLLEAVLRT
jgi:hypothetical protein